MQGTGTGVIKYIILVTTNTIPMLTSISLAITVLTVVINTKINSGTTNGPTKAVSDCLPRINTKTLIWIAFQTSIKAATSTKAIKNSIEVDTINGAVVKTSTSTT